MVKKILIDKLKYTMSDSLNIKEVSSEVLEEYFLTHKKNFLQDAKINITFGHIYFNPQNHDNVESDSRNLLKEISSLPYSLSIYKKSDTFYTGNYFKKLTRLELSKSFSRAFIKKLIQLPQHKWSLLKSGFGIHLIYIEEMKQIDTPFKEIKNIVKDAYIVDKNYNAYKKFYKEIKDEYKIIIENNNSNMDYN